MNRERVTKNHKKYEYQASLLRLWKYDWESELPKNIKNMSVKRVSKVYKKYEV